jgi:hypothetical protein
MQWIELKCSDPNGDSVSAMVVAPPTSGAIYQRSLDNSAALGPAILAQNAPVTHPANTIAYMPSSNDGLSKVVSFTYQCIDLAGTTSNVATATIKVSTPYRPPVLGFGLYALRFDGLYTTSTSRFQNVSSVRSVEMWVKPNGAATNPDAQVLLQLLYDVQGTMYFNMLLQPVWTATGEVQFVLGAANLNTNGSSPSDTAYWEVFSDITTSIRGDTWSHLALVMQDPQVTFYVNGNRAGSGEIGPTSLIVAASVGSQYASSMMGSPSLIQTPFGVRVGFFCFFCRHLTRLSAHSFHSLLVILVAV